VEKIALGRRRAIDGLYRPPKPAVLFNQKSVERAANSMATGVDEFTFKIVYRPGCRGGKPDTLSRRPEYRPEEGARPSE